MAAQFEASYGKPRGVGKWALVPIEILLINKAPTKNDQRNFLWMAQAPWSGPSANAAKLKKT